MLDEPVSHSALTLRDIARMLGLSHVTVSLGLRDHPKIPVARRRQIQDIARKVGYSPNSTAAALSHYKHDAKDAPAEATIAWFTLRPQPTPSPADQGHRCYWRAAFREAERLGYDLEEIVYPPDFPLDHLEGFLSKRNVNGILIPPPVLASDRQDFPWHRHRAVRLGQCAGDAHVPFVASDDVGNAATAFERIWDLGYRRIGLVLTRSSLENSQATAGFLSTRLNRTGAAVLPPLLLSEPGSGKDQAAVTAWLRRQRPDALLLENLPLLQALEMHPGFPGDLGLALLDVSDAEQHTQAGICQNAGEIGRVAVHALLAQINYHPGGIPAHFHHTLVTGTWIDGTSLPPRR